MRQQAASIKNVISSVIQQISGGKREKIDRVKQAWKAAVDKKTYSHTQPAAFKAKRLTINVDSSAWMYELNLCKSKLKTKLNERLKPQGVTVDEIILRIGDTG